MINRAQLKAQAKEQIRGKIGILFIILLIAGAIISVGAVIPVIGTLAVSVFAGPAFSLSIYLIFLKLYNNESIEIGNIFDGFYRFWGAFKVLFFIGLFTFLWSLLFIIPGVIKAYSYSMALYIYAENPEMGALDAIKKSQEMMDGHKMDLFVLELSFIGWALLSTITFGLVGIYVTPYMIATFTNFYKTISAPSAPVEPDTPAV